MRIKADRERAMSLGGDSSTKNILKSTERLNRNAKSKFLLSADEHAAIALAARKRRDIRREAAYKEKMTAKQQQKSMSISVVPIMSDVLDSTNVRVF